MHPVGPQAPATYWKRRIALLLLLLGLLLLVGLGLRALFSGGSDGGAASAPASTTSAGASSTDAPATSSSAASSSTSSGQAKTSRAAACKVAGVTVTAVTDKPSYRKGEKARLEMQITNTGSTPCSLDVGSKAVELEVRSGSRTVWRSSACQVGATSRVTDLSPGAVMRSTVSWDLTAAPSNCSATGTRVAPGDYTLLTRDGGFRSGPKAFRITAG